MLIIIHPEFIERAVFHAVRADGDLQRRYQRAFSACYDAPDAGQRDRDFRNLHETWFRELGLHERLESRTAAFANILARAERLVVFQAPVARRQSAELFGAPGRYTVVVTICLETLLDETAFDAWIRHELLHIDDMLDPAFCYDTNARPEQRHPAGGGLFRDRYALLWAISIDARLHHDDQQAEAVRHRRTRELMQAYGMADESAAKAALDDLWIRFAAARPTHLQLLEMTGFSWTGIAWTADASNDHAGPTPGDACPICRFSTFDWATVERMEGVAHCIRIDRPEWNPRDGLCERCAEVYANSHPAATA